MTKRTDSEVLLRKELGEIGIKDIDRMARLLRLAPTAVEKKRWEEVGVLRAGKLLLDDGVDLEESGAFSIQLILWDLVYIGLLVRCVSEKGGSAYRRA